MWFTNPGSFPHLPLVIDHRHSLVVARWSAGAGDLQPLAGCREAVTGFAGWATESAGWAAEPADGFGGGNTAGGGTELRRFQGWCIMGRREMLMIRQKTVARNKGIITVSDHSFSFNSFWSVRGPWNTPLGPYSGRPDPRRRDGPRVVVSWL